jgi:hypothetical protein
LLKLSKFNFHEYLTECSYDWDLEIVPISDIENYVEIFNLSYAFVDRIKDMQAVTSSIANCLKARLSDALKGAVSDSSTPSKTDHSNEMPDRDSKENLSQKSDTDVSVAETSEDDDFFSTRKSSRERHRIERYQDDLRTVPVNPRKRIPKDTQNTAWDVAIAEWESLTGETYKKRKGEKKKRSHSATSHNHRGSSSYHTNHEWSTNHQHREEHLDNRRSRGDSNDNRKVFSRQFERSSQSSSKREYHRNDIYDEGDYESRREYESGEEYEYGDDEYQYGEDVEYY